MALIVLSHYQIKSLLEARAAGRATVLISPDLNLSTTEVSLLEEGVRFPGGEILSWQAARRIEQSGNQCFTLSDGAINPIGAFSDVTNWARSLFPTEAAPTMLVSGITMHRIKGINPHADTLRKIRAAAPLRGSVLDTATGLGYTAIEAARTAEEVITIELDPVSLDIARLNPWSADLFDNPKITQVVGDACEKIGEFEDEQFSCVIHDPPTFNLAGDLYSGEFYRQVWRVLSRRGRMFHYVGDLDSKSGQTVVRGVIRRLGAAGFTRIERKPDAFGLVVVK